MYQNRPEDETLASKTRLKDKLISNLHDKEALLEETRAAMEGKSPRDRSGLKNDERVLEQEIDDIQRKIQEKDREILEFQLQLKGEAETFSNQEGTDNENSLTAEKTSPERAISHIQNPLIKAFEMRLRSDPSYRKGLNFPESSDSYFVTYFTFLWEDLYRLENCLESESLETRRDILREIENQTLLAIELTEDLTEYQQIKILIRDLKRVSKDTKGTGRTIIKLQRHQKEGARAPQFYIGELSVHTENLKTSIADLRDQLSDLIDMAN